MNRTLIPSLLLLLSACASHPVVEPSDVPPVEVPLAASSDEDGGSMARNVEEWNVQGDKNVALSGYDPVSYFPAGGGTPLPGNPDISASYGGVTYLFANETNREAFVADPAQFEPAHGGWCSYAIGKGEKVSCNPEAFLIEDGRLMLFYTDWATDTRDGFDQDEIAEADAQWEQLSGEMPRN